MPRLATVLVLVSLSAASANAHPPTGIVVDSRGRVFYSDLSRVWMIDGDADPVVVVDRTHTHELWLDSADGVWGEDVPNEGDRYWHRIWVRRVDGTVENVRPLTDGHPTVRNDFGLQRFDDGTAVVAIRGDDPVVRFIDPEGVFTDVPFTAGKGYMHQTGVVDGQAYVVRGSELFRVSRDGTVESVADDLVDRTLLFKWVHDRHAVMGVFEGPGSAVCVAVYAGQSVECVTPAGERHRLLKSPGRWSPSGGTLGPDGAFWVLEIAIGNDVRARRVEL